MPRFVPRQRKHKVLAREKASAHREPTKDETQHEDSNAVVIIPDTQAEKEERRAELRASLLANQSKVSSKKKKRLDHYIDTKLRKEENLELIKKLAATKVDTSLLHSSRKLGVTRESKRDALSQAYREHEAGITTSENGSKLVDEDVQSSFDDDDSNTSGSEHAGPSEHVEVSTERASPDAQPSTHHTTASAPLPSFGSGLKRAFELDDDGRPLIRKRQRYVPSPNVQNDVNDHESRTLPSTKRDSGTDSESDWEGFSSAAASDGLPSDNSETESMSAESGIEDDDDEDNGEQDMARISNFKAWAVQQRNDAIGFTPSANVVVNVDVTSYTPHVPEVEPLPPELEVPVQQSRIRHVHSVHVERPTAIQDVRLALPVVAEEQKIMEAIHNNDVVVVCGATGSGKTTQVPQFLFEAGYGDPNGPTPGLVGVTQPRRVAAVSMADRVSQELGQYKSRVAHQVRFDRSTVNRETAIKFMTDGILLREISQDIALSKYSAIIIDEAHERSVNTDVLIGMLSRVVYNVRAEDAQRDQSMKPLKLIIMSATMRISDFMENPRLFPRGIPPLITAEGRQYPVTIHFARQTQRDYLEEAFNKISRGHRKLPPGAMLVFLTGQNEIVTLAKRLREAFAGQAERQEKEMARPTSLTSLDLPIEAEDLDVGEDRMPNGDLSDDKIDNADLDEDGLMTQDDEFDIGQTDDETRQTAKLDLHVLPLYSQLPVSEQLRVFQPTPEGSRLIVLATNVAETSLTIPGIRYVFDCGRAKEKKYDLRSGVQSFEVNWISKASAAQRTGRAGRIGPGHCYRLYSSALFEAHFDEHTQPEILRTPMENVVLQLKSMGLPKIVNFPFPTPPEQHSLQKAEHLLQCLGALDKESKITALGKKLTSFPLSPRFSRMLVIGQERGIMPLVIALVASLSMPEIFVPPSQVHYQSTDNDELEEAMQDPQKAYRTAQAKFSNLDSSADAIKIFTALSAYSWESQAQQNNETALKEFCDTYFLRAKAMKEATQLRRQLTTIAERNKPGSCGSFSLKTSMPSEAEVHLLRTVVAAGFLDQIAIRADLAPVPPELSSKASKAIDVPYITRLSTNVSADVSDKLVYLHPISVLANRSKSKLPQYIVYSHLQKGTTGKVRMHPLTSVSGAQIAMLAKDTPLLELGKPLGKVQMRGQDVRTCDCMASLVGEKGSTPWPLRTWRVQQRRTAGKGWVLEKVLD